MKFRKLIPAALLLLTAASAHAVPAMPGLIKTYQPDGTPITIRLYGDEHFSWARSADGYTLLRDKSGYWTIARPEASGELAPTNLRIAGNTAAAQAKTLGVEAMLPMNQATVKSLRKAPARAGASDLQFEVTFPPQGKNKMLMILVNFADTKTTFTRQDFDNFMNKREYKDVGSFRDFYLENSYGKLDVETTVLEWVTLPGNKGTYNDGNVPSMIKYALEQVEGTIDLTQFDNNGDGILDGLAVIHQGVGAEASGNTADIWSHSSTIYGLKVGGVEVRNYTIQPELLDYDGHMSNIGVMCHEFGHNLGAPDFYDTDYGNSGGEFCGTGLFDLLGSGAWNGTFGSRPAHINVWQKYMFGWLEPERLTADKTVDAMPDITKEPVAYRFDTSSKGDYFIFENRQKKGAFNRGIPAGGMLIMHINEDIIRTKLEPNTINAAYPQGAYYVAANATQDPDEFTTSYGTLNSDSSPFPNKDGKNAFNDNTFPSTHAVDGRSSYCGLSQITQNSNGTISFKFTVDNAPAAPSALKATTEGVDVHLSWTAPTTETPESYNIYRNGKKIADVKTTEYIDRAPELSGNITYMIDAAYSDGRLSPGIETTIRLPKAKVASLAHEVHEGSVQLKWQVAPEISHLENPLAPVGEFRMLTFSAESMEYGQKFCADDLTTYVGTKIRNVAFIPYQGLQEAKYIIKIYEAAAGGTPEVVSSREVKELGVGIWNTILLTKTVEIKPEHDYIIAIEITPNVQVAQILTYPTGKIEGMSNLIKLGGEEWKEASEAFGPFFIYGIISDAVSEKAGEIIYSQEEIDPDRDLNFPIGFRVYRDGQLIGESSTRTYFDAPRPGGKHTYQVTTVYKGGNETAPCEAVEVNTDVVGITTLENQKQEKPLYRLDGTRATSTDKGILLRKGEKILK